MPWHEAERIAKDLPPEPLQAGIARNDPWDCSPWFDYRERNGNVVHEHAPSLPAKRAGGAPNHYRLEIVTRVPDPSGPPAAASEHAAQQL
jgi:hypothetical protein